MYPDTNILTYRPKNQQSGVKSYAARALRNNRISKKKNFFAVRGLTKTESPLVDSLSQQSLTQWSDLFAITSTTVSNQLLQGGGCRRWGGDTVSSDIRVLSEAIWSHTFGSSLRHKIEFVYFILPPFSEETYFNTRNRLSSLCISGKLLGIAPGSSLSLPPLSLPSFPSPPYF